MVRNRVFKIISSLLTFVLCIVLLFPAGIGNEFIQGNPDVPKVDETENAYIIVSKK